MNSKTSWPLTILIAVALAACSALPGASTPEATGSPAVVQEPSAIIAEGRVVPHEDANLFFSASGEVIEVLVKEGDQVKKGDPLARLGDRETLEARLASAKLELISAQQALDDLKTHASLAYSQALIDLANAEKAYTDAQEKLDAIDTTAYQDRIDTERSAVADAQTELNDAQDEFDKYKDLGEDQPNRKNAKNALDAAQDKYNAAVRRRDRLVNDLDQAKAALQMASAALEDARSTSDARKDGPDPKDLALAQGRLDAAQAQLAAAEADLARLDLVAPFDGTIVQVDISQGEHTLPNQSVMVIADFSQWYVETTDLTENEVVWIAPGQTARVVPDALPDLTMTGKIESISDKFIEKSGDINYKVRLTLADPDPQLRWGMTVEVQFNK